MGITEGRAPFRLTVWRAARMAVALVPLYWAVILFTAVVDRHALSFRLAGRSALFALVTIPVTFVMALAVQWLPARWHDR